MHEFLKSGPGPHYLLDAQASDDGTKVEGTALFSSEEHDSVASRSNGRNPHVNQADMMLSAWNAAHLLKEKWGMDELASLKSVIETPRVTLPDTEVHIRGAVTLDEKKSTAGIKRGTYRVEFTQDQVRCALLEVTFVAWRNREEK